MQPTLFDELGMPINIERITAAQTQRILEVEEGQFGDVKAIAIAPAQLSKAISAFANADGGDLYIGLEEHGPDKQRVWAGFKDAESANGHLQVFERLFPLGTDFQYEFLRADDREGLVLHVQINKTRSIVRASNNIPYIRRGAQSLPVETPDAIKRLEYAKGISSFEDESTNVLLELVTDSDVIKEFMKVVVPRAQPLAWLKKQALVRDNKVTVAGVLIFADEPQAQLPKRCGIK